MTYKERKQEIREIQKAANIEGARRRAAMNAGMDRAAAYQQRNADERLRRSRAHDKRIGWI